VATISLARQSPDRSSELPNLLLHQIGFTILSAHAVGTGVAHNAHRLTFHLSFCKQN